MTKKSLWVKGTIGLIVMIFALQAWPALALSETLGSGKISDFAGNPMPGTTVEIPGYITVKVDEDGSFAIMGMPPGISLVRYSAPGYFTTIKSLYFLNQEREHMDAPLFTKNQLSSIIGDVDPDKGVIFGEITASEDQNPGLQPVITPSIGEVLYLDEDGHFAKGSATTARGYFCLKNVPPGRYTVTVGGHGDNWLSYDIEVKAEEIYLLMFASAI